MHTCTARCVIERTHDSTEERPARHNLSGRPTDWAMHNDNDWLADALCAQTDPEAFHPEKGGSVRAPMAVCAACPVREECLADALAKGDVYDGYRGGKSPRQRRALYRKQFGPEPPEPEVDLSKIMRILDNPRSRKGGTAADRLNHAEGKALYDLLKQRGVSRRQMEITYGLRARRYDGLMDEAG